MTIEHQLRTSLQEKGSELNPSPELKMKVMSKLSAPTGGKFAKRLIVAALTVLLVIPTSAYAYQNFVADEVYGSFEVVKKQMASATMEGYYLLSAKLLQASGEMDKETYAQFKEQLKVITSAKLKYADQYGNIDYDQVPAHIQEQLKQTLLAIQPYFDQLNGLQSSNDVLSSEEYVTYIDSLMTYEKALAQSGINTSDGPVEVEMILPQLQDEFIAAREFIWYVDDMQRQAN